MPHHLDFFGSGVDTVWAVPMGSVLDPATILRTAGIAGTVPARPPPQSTRKAENRHLAPPRAVRGCLKSGCTMDDHGTRHNHDFAGDGSGDA